ncbi:MAG: hypothetical protein M3430_04455 [Acidobacteriota bacterium]|nr:hypothetical protein [Acidobacteriota bacterium]
MVSKKAQSKAGLPARRRGQQMGDERSPINKDQEAKDDVPALSGRRGEANEFFADASSQAVGSDGDAPSAVSPSTPAAIPTGESLGQSNAEKVFKGWQAKARRK